MHTPPSPLAARFAGPHCISLATRAAARATAPLDTGRRIAQALALLEATVQPGRRVVHAGDVLYRSGDPFTQLHILNAGFFKLLSVSSDGREQVVGLKFRGDWLGFGAIAKGSYACDAVAMDTAEVWSVRYDALLQGCIRNPALMEVVHEAMSAEIMRDRDLLIALATLPADARVATFLHYWADALATRGLRTDQFSLRLTRAEIGNYLGLTLETVSRVLSRLARARLITFTGKNRRDVCIPDLQALDAFVHGSLGDDLH